jgi:hypothetical protein
VRLTWPGWQPEGVREVPVRALAEGSLIEVDRALWRVTGIRDVPVAEWDDRDREHYELHTTARRRAGQAGGPPDPGAWSLRPVWIAIAPAGGGPGRRLRCQPYAFRFATANVIPAHHPVCAACGELYPCRHLEQAVTPAACESRP